MKKKVLAAFIAAMSCVGTLSVPSMMFTSLAEKTPVVQVEEKTPEELEAMQEFGTAFCEYMHSNSKQAGASLAVPSGILTIAYFEEDEALVKAYIAQSGVDESDIRYEYLQHGFDLDEGMPSAALKGDANNDGTVDMSDVVLIMQALANPNKYGENGTAEIHLTAQGKLNADVDGNGLTVADAQVIQMMLLGLFNETEPPLTQVQPLDFRNTDDVIEKINNYDLSDYSEHEEVSAIYKAMFERFKSDGFIYSVIINQDIQLKENSKIWLKPDNKLEDMGIKYTVVSNGKSYDVLLRSAYTDITAETNGISEYYSKRFGRDFDHEVLINGRKYGVSSSSDGSQISVSTFVDKEHYVTVIGNDNVSEDELKDFAGWLVYEKLYLEPNTQVTVGYDYVMKPKTTERLALKCNTYCAKGEKLSVDAAMGDIYTVNSDEWHYEYEIFVCDPLNYKNIEDERFIVNGESGGYKKVYPKGEESIFDISENELDYDLYNHETAEIDFSNYEAGSTGCIEFSYLYRYEIDPKQHMGAIRCLYFYVGERGTGISGKSIEDAKNSYETNVNKAPVSHDMDMGYVELNGKKVTFQLMEELRKNVDSEVGVVPEFVVDYDFVYNGKTINEYREEWHYNSGLYEKYAQLFKEGDSLKYGEALYTTGDANGMKWDKEWYELRVEFYGREFLAKYIVNGEFLREKAEADHEAFINDRVSERSYIAFHEALDMYDRYMIEESIQQLQQQNVRYEYAEKPNELVIYVTGTGFDALSLENVSYYKVPTIYSEDTMTLPIVYDF